MDNNSKPCRCMYLKCAFISKSHSNLDLHELIYPRKKMHCPETSGKHDKTVKSDYRSELSQLTGKPSDVVG